MPKEFYVDSNTAGLRFLRLKTPSGPQLVMPLGMNEQRAITAAQEYVNLLNDPGATLVTQELLDPENVIVPLKEHRGKTLSKVLIEDPTYLVWFYSNYRNLKHVSPSGVAFYNQLTQLAGQPGNAFSKSLSLSCPESCPVADSSSLSKFQGIVGDTLCSMATLQKQFTLKSKGRAQQLVKLIFTTTDGVITAICTGSLAEAFSYISKLGVGRPIVITGRVVRHSEYRGEKQTELSGVQLQPNSSVGIMIEFQTSRSDSQEKLRDWQPKHPLISSTRLTHVNLQIPESIQSFRQGSALKYAGVAYFSCELFAPLMVAELREIIANSAPKIDGLAINSTEIGCSLYRDIYAQ